MWAGGTRRRCAPARRGRGHARAVLLVRRSPRCRASEGDRARRSSAGPACRQAKECDTPSRAAAADQKSAKLVGFVEERECERGDARTGEHERQVVAGGERVRAIENWNVALRIVFGRPTVSAERRGLGIEPVAGRREQGANALRETIPRAEQPGKLADPGLGNGIQRRIGNDRDFAGHRLDDRDGGVPQIAPLLSGREQVPAERIRLRSAVEIEAPVQRVLVQQRLHAAAQREEGCIARDPLAHVAMRDQRGLRLHQLAAQQVEILHRPGGREPRRERRQRRTGGPRQRVRDHGGRARAGKNDRRFEWRVVGCGGAWPVEANGCSPLVRLRGANARDGPRRPRRCAGRRRSDDVGYDLARLDAPAGERG